MWVGLVLDVFCDEMFFIVDDDLFDVFCGCVYGLKYVF